MNPVDGVLGACLTSHRRLSQSSNTALCTDVEVAGRARTLGHARGVRDPSLSWIPSEAVTGAMRTAFDKGPGHYDSPRRTVSAAWGSPETAEASAIRPPANRR